MAHKKMGQASFVEAFLRPEVEANRRLQRIDGIDWAPLERLVKPVRPGVWGRPSYPPLAMLKALLLQRWYALSDEGLEEAQADWLSFRRFLRDPRRHDGVPVWELDGDIITVFIPIAWKRQGGRKVIIAPDGGDAWAPAKPRPDETLIRALARAHRWKQMLEEGTCRSVGEIAEAEKINRSFVSRILNLSLLAPDIVEAILDGRQPKSLMLEDVARGIAVDWRQQRAAVGVDV